MTTRSVPLLPCLLLLLAGPLFAVRTFKQDQLRYARVRAAYQEKEADLKALFAKKDLPYPPAAICIRVFKTEMELELWAQARDGRFALLKVYPVCAVSGSLGPKRREGDVQVPEGFYHINLFNPVSRFHLSMQINYPNASDRILGKRDNLGGIIFIHGSCVTIGCVPILDNNIKEVYLLAVEAQAAGQSRIPVHIFPARLTEDKLKRLKDSFSADKSLIAFWENLRQGYDFFEHNHRLPRITVDAKGVYRFGN